jgi:hypothetical protein
VQGRCLASSQLKRRRGSAANRGPRRRARQGRCSGGCLENMGRSVSWEMAAAWPWSSVKEAPAARPTPAASAGGALGGARRQRRMEEPQQTLERCDAEGVHSSRGRGGAGWGGELGGTLRRSNGENLWERR